MAGMWNERRCASKLLLADKISLIFILSVAIGQRFISFFFPGTSEKRGVTKARIIFLLCSNFFFLDWKCDERKKTFCTFTPGPVHFLYTVLLKVVIYILGPTCLRYVVPV